MPVTDDYITIEGLDFIQNFVTSKRRTDKKALRLDDKRYPTFNWLTSRARDIHSVGGGYRMEVKGGRNQEEEAWDGADKLTFHSHATPFPLVFMIGKTHFGNSELYDFLERQGFELRYGADPGDRGSPRAAEVVLDYLMETADDIQEAIMRSRAKRLMLANTDNPKYYVGLDGLLPADNNSVGQIGGADRSNPLLQHVIQTDIDLSNQWVAEQQFCRELNRWAAGSGDVVHNACGDNMFDMLCYAWSPNASGVYRGAGVPRGFDISASRAEAARYAEKFAIGLPGEAFVDPYGNLIYNDQVFKDLDEMENPAIKWSDRRYRLSNHLQVYVEKDKERVSHGMPRDQVVWFESVFSAMSLVVKAPRSCGIQIRKTS